MVMSAFLPEQLSGATVLVLGLGRFQGGVETARYLARHGARCRISDAGDPRSLDESADAARALGADVVFGPQTPDLLDGIDAVIASPAIPFAHPVIEAALSAGVPTTTEAAIALGRAPAPVYGVTGTKGKSTTATLLARMLEAAGHRVHLGGNIGRPLVGVLDDIQADDRIVLELSSFQLWWARRAGISPHVTLVTNLFADHLDRHGDMAAYAEAKRAALDFQSADDLAVLPAADARVREAGWFEAGRARRVTYGPSGEFTRIGTRLLGPGTSIQIEGIPLLGSHNRANALGAAAAVLSAGDASAAAVRDGALATKPLPHRMEPVCERGGVTFVDDSNATNPRSTICALDAMARPVILLVGGKDKGVDATELVARIGDRARAVVGIGTTGPALVEALGDEVPTAVAPDMPSAVRAAAGMASPGDVVLLSPAYSSLDQYPSFAVRGDRFQDAARALPQT